MFWSIISVFNWTDREVGIMNLADVKLKMRNLLAESDQFKPIYTKLYNQLRIACETKLDLYKELTDTQKNIFISHIIGLGCETYSSAIHDPNTTAYIIAADQAQDFSACI